MKESDPTLSEFQSRMLAEGLRGLFGEVDDAVLADLLPALEWVEVAGGEVVMRKGDTDQDLYIVISGRLRAFGSAGPSRRRERPGPSEGPDRRFLNEVRRGETLGEVSFITGGARTATVVASRDSVLARFTRPRLEALVEKYPRLAFGMAKLMVARLQRSNAAGAVRRRPTNLCLLPITPGVDALALGERLVAHFPTRAEAVLVTAGSIEERTGVPGIAGATTAQGDRYRQLTQALDALEASHASVVYVPDRDLDSEWSRRCLRMADRILLLADAAASPALSAVEARLFADPGGDTLAEQVLVLLHDENSAVPRGTAQWLSPRAAGRLRGQVHVRPSRAADMARLARTQSAQAVGLVLCGGGARCLAQLGVYKALREHGVSVDCVGGAGLGALMAALVALDRPPDEIIAYAKEAFSANPTGDVSLMPVTSLLKGRQLKAIVDDAILHLAHAGAGLEDTWKTYFCVASNYSKASEVVLWRGPLARSIRASAAVPGLLPPVPVDGDLLVDGGAFNNYPVDVMRRAGTLRIVGVNLARETVAVADMDDLPGGWTLTWDRLTGRRRQFRVPGLLSILMNSVTLASASREAEESTRADLEFRLNLPSVGLLDFQSFDHAVKVGYEHAARHLAAMSREELAPYLDP